MRPMNRSDSAVTTVANTSIERSQKPPSDRQAAHAVFIYDGVYPDVKRRIDQLCAAHPALNTTTLAISGGGLDPMHQKRYAALDSLQQKVRVGAIGSDTLIFIKSHTYTDVIDGQLYFSFKNRGNWLRISVEDMFDSVWRYFPGDQKPTFHILGCNSGTQAEALQTMPGRVFCHAGKSLISTRVALMQAEAVLDFVSQHVNQSDTLPDTEAVWQHMECHAIQDMAITGKGSHAFHSPMTLPSWSTRKSASGKSHKNPKALFEFAMRYRPAEEVEKLVKANDPGFNIIGKITESAKKRILMTLIPSRVNWHAHDAYYPNETEKQKDNRDSESKMLFCLKHGLLPNLSVEESDALLRKACDEGLEGITRIMLTRGIFPLSEEGKQAALHKALTAGDEKLVELVLEHVNKVSGQDDELNTAVHMACKHEDGAILALILGPNGLDVFPSNTQSDTPNLHVGLLEQRNKAGRSPMEVAIKHGSIEALEMLLNAGVDPNQVNDKGATPLQQAIRRNSPYMVKLLLDHGAEVHRHSSDAEPLLCKATRRGMHDVARLLTTHLLRKNQGDQINQRHGQGLPPFLMAVKNNDLEMMNIFLLANADYAATDASGRNAFHILASNSLIKLKNQYKDHAQGSEARENAASELMRKTASIQAQAKRLLSLRIPINERDTEGNTPLITAAKEGNDVLCLFLINHRANPSLSNKAGYTALHYALQNKDHDLSDVLLVGTDLLDAGFDLQKALDLATEADNQNAIRKIREAMATRGLPVNEE